MNFKILKNEMSFNFDRQNNVHFWLNNDYYMWRFYRI